ncbi:MAG TPA: FAD-dependent oxidoreductase [Azoarcus sp.]|nr:FAD-dependent oxidoreductase [Azoarcus sp.]
MSQKVVILGSGLAGYNVAREFRKLDKTSHLVIISRDAADFYSKPMLSNALSGNKTAASLVMKPREKMAEELNADIRPNTEVHAVSTAEQTVTLADGERMEWSKLVFALGADPIRLSLEGDGAEDILSVNDLNDFARFAEKLDGVREVVLLGGGLIGCEFANDLLSQDIRTTVVDIAERPLGRLLPDEAAGFFRERLEEAGVRFHFQAGATAVERDGKRYRVRLNDGATLEADLVVSAIGLRPRTQLASDAGCASARGIVTDRFLATSCPNVYAVGDCAEINGLNLPFVMPIMHQARALAATLSGTPTELDYPAMPVMVKTPACPTVVCPPAAGAEGSWQVEDDGEGVTALFRSADDRLLGFVLLGTATARRQELSSQVPRPFEA